jgi:hypothetical protein
MNVTTVQGKDGMHNVRRTYLCRGCKPTCGRVADGVINLLHCENGGCTYAKHNFHTPYTPSDVEPWLVLKVIPSLYPSTQVIPFCL